MADRSNRGSGGRTPTTRIGSQVDALEAACAHAAARGATLADQQPQDDVRVHLDPDGHPLCPFLPGA